jgi:hypothetical protein
MKGLFKYIGISLLLFIVGFLLSKRVFYASYSLITSEMGHILLQGGVSSFFKERLWFAFIVGVIPSLYFLWKKVTQKSFINKGIISSLIILSFGTLFWILRSYLLKGRFKRLDNFDIGFDPLPTMNLENLHLTTFAFIGLVIGTILSILIYRKTS